MSAETFLMTASAQQMRDVATQGYITAVRLPVGFEVNGMHVTLHSDTAYGLQKDRVFRTDSPLRDEIRVGAYVFVLGAYSNRHKTADADKVLFRDDWNRKLSGLGVIDKVISTGPVAVYRADGYSVRVAPATEALFAGSLKTLADVGTNT